MCVFVTNLACLLLLLICIVVLNCIGASDVAIDTSSRPLSDIVGHVTDVFNTSDGDMQLLLGQKRRCRGGSS